MSKKENKQQRSTVLTSHFKLIFISIVALTMCLFIASTWLAVSFDDPSAQVGNLIETFSSCAKIGFGAVVGLLGAKLP